MKIFLNLLPPERKQEMVKGFYWRYFLGQWFIVFLLSLLALGVMGALYVEVQMQARNQQKKETAAQETERQGEYEKYEKKFEEANNQVKSANAFLTLHTSFSNLLSQLELSLPESIRIEKISTQSFKVFLTGTADTRESFLLLQENIKSNTCFESLNTPLSNLFSESDVQFQIDFLVKKECLRGSVPKI